MLGEGFITPDNVQKKELFYNTKPVINKVTKGVELIMDNEINQLI